VSVNKTDEEYAMARYVFPNDPALSAAVVTPSDTDDLPNYSRMLYIADGGTGQRIKVTMLNGGEPVIFNNVPTGMLLVQVRKVWATDTNVADVVAVW
jgi:hypothetical protein